MKPNIQRLLDAVSHFQVETRQVLKDHLREPKKLAEEFENCRQRLKLSLCELGIGDVFDYSEE